MIANKQLAQETISGIRCILMWLSWALLCFFGLTLVACGGGSSGSGSTTAIPESPTLALDIQAIKTFHFSWTDVNDETEYHLLENPDGISGFTQVDTIVADATSDDLQVLLPARFNARYMLEACNSAGCSDSNEVSVSGNLTRGTGYFKASNTGADDTFGFAIALAADGKTLAVGAIKEDSSASGVNNGNPADDLAGESGAVYIFTRDTAGNWSQQAYVKASNTDAGDAFGASVALAADGNTLAVSAPLESSSATGVNNINEGDNSSQASGAVYIFSRDTVGNWSQQAYVKASNTEILDRFGITVALAADGNTLAVGSYSEDSDAKGINGNQNNNLAPDSGAVYVFTRAGVSWSQQAYIKASNTEGDDQFGWSVALSAKGFTLAVGAWSEDSKGIGINSHDENDNSVGQSGAVYVFTLAGSTWSQQAYIKASNTGLSDWFGRSIALAADGSTLAVGAYLEDSNATGIFPPSSTAQLNNSAADSGAVYIFTRDAGTWSEQAYIKASNAEADDRFGRSLALAFDGNTLVVGANQEDSNSKGINGDPVDNSALNSGTVYVFSRDGIGTWSQQDYVKASNTGTNDAFGISIAIAADGITLAIGATGEASGATGINGFQVDDSSLNSGAVYLY